MPVPILGSEKVNRQRDIADAMSKMGSAILCVIILSCTSPVLTVGGVTKMQRLLFFCISWVVYIDPESTIRLTFTRVYTFVLSITQY